MYGTHSIYEVGKDTQDLNRAGFYIELYCTRGSDQLIYNLSNNM